MTARTAILVLATLSACMPPGSEPGTPQSSAGLPPELIYCRAKTGDEQRSSEVVLRTAQNLGTTRIGDRNGRELHARVSPDGLRVVFAREMLTANEQSRDLFAVPVDNSAAEFRLTANNDADDAPCWSPDGARVLYSTGRTDRRLWTIGNDGTGAREFLAAVAGVSDSEPDWHWGTDRIVFTRTAQGVSTLWTVQGSGAGLLPLTPGPADSQPCFAPDGASVVFVRGTASSSRLFQVSTITGIAVLLFDPQGAVALPRWSPRGDRIFCAISQPQLGRPGLRLSRLRADGGDPLLLLPDVRFACAGLDVLPALGPEPAAGTAAVLDPGNAEVRAAGGTLVLGGGRELRSVDNEVVALTTATFEGNEVAGLMVKFTLPIDDPTKVVALRVKAVAAVSRADASTRLRLCLENPVERRFDTITEVQPADDSFLTLTFATASLAHVSRDRQVTVEVVGEIGPGSRAMLNVDQIEVTLVPVAAPVAVNLGR